MFPLLQIERGRSWYRFLRWCNHPRERAAGAELPARTRAWLLRRGFWPTRHRLYHLERNEPGRYFSDRQELLSRSIDGPYGAWLDDKALFHATLGHLLPLPPLSALVRGGRIEWRQTPERDLIALLHREGKLVAKPPRASRGHGVLVLEATADGLRCNQQPLSAEAMRRKLTESGDFLVTAFVRQGAYAARFYPATLNTLRVVTMMDPGTDEPFVAFALQRVGGARTFPVDNFSAGGFACHVDIESGKLAPALSLGEVHASFVDRHPETGVTFTAQVIPDWHGVCARLLRMVRRLPMLPYAGWDLALGDDGFTIIEGNSWAGLHINQANLPALADERVRRFFRHYRVL